MTASTDGDVVRRVLGGDAEAFGSLVERYQDGMLAYVRYMGFDEADAYDIVQEGFLRAYRHLGRCGDPERFDGWLFKIVSNVCRTAGKRRRKRRTEPLDGHGATLPSDRPGPDERAERNARRERVREALRVLPADQREALVLMYLQDRSVKEISEMTGASPSAVKMRLKRGREALRGRLDGLAGEVAP